MRHSLLIACAIFIALTCAFGQAPELIRVHRNELFSFIKKEEYRYPEFMKARVYFNNGDSAGGMLNYNYLQHAMMFIDDKNDTVAIADEKNINYVKIGTDTFFYDNGFYQLIASSSTAKLAVKYVLKTSGPQKTGAYGFAAPTADVESWIDYKNFTNQKLGINEEFVFVRQKIYYVSGSKKHFVEANSKNISRLFPKKDVNTYIKENKLNLNDEKDVMRLFAFLNTV